jgi:hypothetical protein
MRPRSTPTKRASVLVFAVLAALALVSVRGSRGEPHVAPPDTVKLVHHALIADYVSGRPDLPQAHNLPAMVFVVRNQPSGRSTQIPGFGPGGRTLTPGGRLVVRERDGRLRNLLRDSTLYDVSDPAVSWDARRIAFSGVEEPGGPWRLYIVGTDGSGLRPLTRSDRRLDLTPLGESGASRFDHYDDFDPCWLPDGRVVFASTRFPQRSQEGAYPVSNLFVVNADGTGLQRITSERNGAEEPAIDATGRIVYARWFFNPYMATELGKPAWTLDRSAAAPSDSIDNWQLVSIFPDGDRIQLAAGQLRLHRRAGTYQPCVLRDGTLVGVEPERASLVPSPRTTSLVAFGRDFGTRPVRLTLPGGFAVSPAALSDDRIVFSYAEKQSMLILLDSDPEPSYTRSSFGLFTLSSDRPRTEARVLEIAGRDLLDPAPIVKRKVPPVIPAQGGIDDPAWTLPVTRLDQVRRGDDTFRFDCLNVYLTGPVDSPFPDAPRIAPGARIRFFAALARPDAATGDTVVLVRESKLDAGGAVHESDIPGDVPMFEQLVDADGRIMRSAHGPAHVPGSNFSRIGSGTKCVGCHEGHSALPVPRNNLEARWFNASTSATVRVSSTASGSAAALVDRRAKGPIAATGWVAERAEGQWARLSWAAPIEAHAIVLYAPSADGRAGTHLQVRSCQLVFFRDGLEVGRAIADRVRPEGTRVDFPPVRLDAVEVRPTRVTGTVDGRPAVALAEIETIARLIE